MKNTQTTFNISQAFGHFWELSDRTQRIMYIGGVMVALAVLSFLFNFVMIIPFVGWVIGGIGLLAVGIVSLLAYMYLQGFRYELAEVIAEGKSVQSIPILDRYAVRIRVGAKFVLATVLYYVPLIVVYVILFALLMLAVGLLSDTSGSIRDGSTQAFGVILMILFIFAVIILSFVQFIYQSALELALARQYYRERSFGSLLQVGEVWETIQTHFGKILLYTVLNYAIQLGFGVVVLVCYVLIFLCVGIIALPVAYAVYSAYTLHFKAEMIGQFIALTETSGKD